MKISVSLSDEDIEFLDEYAKSLGVRSRSAVIQRAVRLLRVTGLGPAYAEAWEEWEATVALASGTRPPPMELSAHASAAR